MRELADLVSGTLEFGYGYYSGYNTTSITTAADLNFGSAAVTLADSQITINNNVTAGSFTISSAQSSSSQPAISLASGKTITTTAGGISMTASGSNYDVSLLGMLVAGGGTAAEPTGSVYVDGANVTLAGGVTANSGVSVYGSSSIAVNSNIAAGGQVYLSASNAVPLTLANGVSVSGTSFDLYGGSVAIGSNVSLAATGAGYSSEITAYSSYSGSGTVPLTIGSGSAITTANGALYVTADEVSIGGTINVGTAEFFIGPYNAGGLDGARRFRDRSVGQSSRHHCRGTREYHSRNDRIRRRLLLLRCGHVAGHGGGSQFRQYRDCAAEQHHRAQQQHHGRGLYDQRCHHRQRVAAGCRDARQRQDHHRDSGRHIDHRLRHRQRPLAAGGAGREWREQHRQHGRLHLGFRRATSRSAAACRRTVRWP